VDHRLVREGYVLRCDAPSLGLYLVLLTVADADGVSFYRDQSLCRLLRWSPVQLQTARRQLVQAGLVAYRHPFWQVLSLEPEPSPGPPVGSPRPPEPERPASREEVTAILADWRRNR